jgi:hypothetical protein
MEHFISAENVRHYRKLLSDPEVAQNPLRHALLLRLLAEEVDKGDKPTV